ncbi:LytR/AlgR family response regulator transcription factor [Polaribacter sp.]|uniref:LytR/AlgR family response regulator transcription factor n=1 Tax=Polaribacter sp. TaxID=1920175 RepID=UPI003F6CCA58
MNKLTSFVVDDIPEALELLCNDIEEYHPEIEIIGKASSVVEASKLLQTKKPDILFLDIMLGDGTGFDILEIISNLTAKVIFVTASEEYAIKAFKFAAVDYILKPYSIEDLSTAIHRVKEQIHPKTEQLSVLKQLVNKPTEQPSRLSLHTSEKIIVVPIKDIIRCKADNNYTTFYMQDQSKILVSKTLKYYADILKEVNFLRVHQSHLVNKSFIKEFIKSDGGYLVLKDTTNIPVSARKKSEIISALKK